MNVIWKWIPHTTITIDRPTFNTSIKLFFLLLSKELSHRLIHFRNFISFVCGTDDHYFEKKGHTFRPLHGYSRALDYSSLILDLMYKSDRGAIYFMTFVRAWIHLKRCLLQFLICDCSDSNIKKLNYHFHIKFTPVKGTCVDLISL